MGGCAFRNGYLYFYFIFLYALSRLVWELTHIQNRTRAAGEEGREREGKNSGKQRHEICGRERDGAGYTVNKMTLQGFPGPCTTGTFRKEIREFEGGGFGVD